jgi:capsular exopolysaccharide synthesis family protein
MKHQEDGNGSFQREGPPGGRGTAHGTLMPTEDRSLAMPLSTPPPAPTQNPKALLAAFRRTWFISVSVGLLFGCAAAAVTWYLVDAPYTAFSELLIKSTPEKVVFAERDRSGFQTYKETIMRRAKSPFVLAAAIRDQEIANLPIIAQAQYPVDWLEQNLRVSSPAAEFIRLSLSGESPRELADVVNAVTEAFLKELETVEHVERRKRKQNLDDIHRELEDKLRGKRTSLVMFAKKLGGVNDEALTMQQQLAVQYVGQLRREHTRIRFELMQTQTDIASKKTGRPSQTDVSISADFVDYEIDQNVEVRQIQSRIAKLENRFSRTEKVAEPDNPELQELKKQLDEVKIDLLLKKQEIRPKIVQQLQAGLTAASAASLSELAETVKLLTFQEQTLKRELESQNIKSKAIGIESFELQVLKSDIEQQDTIRKRVSEEIQRLGIELGAAPRINIIRKAEAPHFRTMGKKYKVTALAGFAVFGFFAGGIVLLDYRGRRISSLDEVIDGLNMRILGSLPIMPRWMANGSTQGGGRKSAMRSIWTESIDSTRTMLLRDASLESMNIVMVVSAMEGEGKSTLACHLATSLARAGRKTLLLDSDMRRPSLHKVFEVPLNPGFSELLRGNAEFEDVIHPTSPEGLFIMPAGKIHQQTLSLLAKDAAEGVFEKLKEDFDFIVVDSAPVLPVTDSLMIGQHVDSAIFSIRRDVSRFGKVSAAYQRLTMLGIPVLGAVVIGLDETSYGYRHPYRYYAYGNGYNLHPEGSGP